MDSGSGNDSENDNNISRKILRPYNTLRNIHDQRTLLVIAAEGCLNLPHDLKSFTEGDPAVNVRYTARLPLPNHDKHPPIDAIALVYQVFNQDSLSTIERSIPLIDVRYFTGKCFIVVFSDIEFHEDDTKDIEKLANSYLLPLHYAHKIKPQQLVTLMPDPNQC
ncbi:centromere protein m [Plakobranchus ocellatus]|uniref:Centromere protein M n=1 Tax=Plakobranchus ocellatus TaxID=259542 RepID=A0AAV4AQ42_9GAST|nr:centromere protein m [Plakobranchus ocellatus]